ncbi:MAG TPA: hypothetical protein VK604_15095 [Bryobacteraceae bacterium]|nr:hypothetical protein [Bryobacteraceae bacterium]
MQQILYTYFVALELRIRIDYSESMAGNTSQPPSVEQVQMRFEQLQARLNAAKIAHLNGATLDGHEVSYETLRQIAEEMIQANYELQRSRYGAVRLKLSVAKLLRRGR